MKKLKMHLLVLFASLTVSTSLGLVYYQYSLHEDISRHDLLAEELFIKLQQKFLTYEQIAFGAKGLLLSSPEVKWDKWETYVESQKLHDRFDDSLSIAYIPKIPHDELNLFVDSMRKTFPNYDVYPHTENNIHYPLMFLSPLSEKLKPVLGLDNGAEPLRRWCGIHSIDTGKSTLSDLLTLKEDENRPQHAALLCMPIYETAQDPLNVDDRRKQHVGFITLAFHFNPFITEVYGTGSRELNLKIYDNSNPENLLIYDHAKENNLKVDKNFYKKSYELNLLEKNWLIVFQDTDDSFFPVEFPIILGMGYSISGGLYYILRRNHYLKKESEKKKLDTIGLLSSRLAHDIRNPLSIIQITLDNLKLIYGENEAQKKQFEKIQRSIFRITHQIDDVLDFVRKQPLTLKKAKISDVISDALDSIFIPNDIQLKLPKNDFELICDSKKLSIAFNNIILNAIQAMNGKGLIAIGVEETDDKVIIEIEDSGKGILKKDLKKIFVPLFTTKQAGTGLGLASVKSIIDAHHGTISVTSTPTIFTITLPKTQ